MFPLKLVQVLPVLLDQARAVLAAPAVVLRESPVFCLQANALRLDARHLISHDVQVTLQLVLHLPGQTGAVGADLLKMFLLLRAGELEAEVCGEERVDLHQESSGDIQNRVQGHGELLFGCLPVELKLLL